MSETHTTADIHREKVFEAHIVDRLTRDQGYIERDCARHYDVAHALDTELLFRFLKTTQPDAWQVLEDHYSAQAEAEVLKRLDKALKDNPTHVVLREGLKLVPNIRFALCFFKPASNLNPDLTRAFEANILSVMRQVTYSARNRNALDIVTFVNGIPVATLEVKNLLTGQNVKHAEKQYRTDRSPAGEPLLTFKRGAIVHFAVDQDNVSMTTRLMNGKTRFLPFNRGRDGGAGNPDFPGENRVAYLYKDLPEGKAVLSREVLLDLIGRFIHLERSDGKEVLIFPRFQQFDAVRKVLADATAFGAGRNYLIQHSAGSGKSNTIAWTAHQIINLHDMEDRPLFDTAIIVTDRLVLDRQLQNTIGGFAQTEGVVKKIDGTSRDLKDAIVKGARIIITTIQKFGTDHLATISGQAGRNFAVIIDEAHSSQSGKAAQAMSDALTRDANSSDDIEDLVLAFQKARGPQKNISFLAFTATPRNVTLERFGRIASDGKPHPFHLYSMRQAIEEGFILDVLQNYMTYKAYYQLEKTIEDDPAFKGRRAQSRVARYASLHPTAIDQKVEVIVEHFRRHVAKQLGGRAKVMIVTQSREHALRYWQQLSRYIDAKGYSDLKALVAFSGDLNIDGNVWTEATANGFAETELPKKFDTDSYQVLVVAEKYQTGFDQPKLVAMYVDKKLAGLQAVQTLARLNRTYAGKDQTFVLDFQNTMEEVKTAFAPFFEATALEERTDLNQIYDLEQRITSSTYIHKDEVSRFADQFFKGDLTTQDRLALEGTVRLAVERFVLDEDEAQQEEFRQLLKSFLRFYAFVAQVVSLNDPWLEKLYAYASWLSRLLPSRDVPADITIDEPTTYELESLFVNNAEMESILAELNRFNPIKTMGMQRMEIRHSAILGWLLSPQETHGLGDAFLKAFLSQALKGHGNAMRPTALEVIQTDLMDVEVRREWQNIDMLVLSPRNQWIFVIENKFDSVQRTGQLTEYIEKVRSIFIGEDGYLHVRGIFLTLWEEKPHDEDYAPIRYADICTLLERVALSGSRPLAVEVEIFLKHYLHVIQEATGMSDEMEQTKQLARQLYQSHRKALDFIMKHGRGTGFTIAVETITGSNAPEYSQLFEVNGKQLRFGDYNDSLMSFHPIDWITALGGVDTEWQGCKRYPLVCCFRLLVDSNGHSGRLRLSVEIAPISDEAFRQELVHDLSEIESDMVEVPRRALERKTSYPDFLNNADIRINDIWSGEEIGLGMKVLLQKFDLVFAEVTRLLPKYQRYGRPVRRSEQSVE